MIKNYSQIQNTLKAYDAKNWSKSAELGSNANLLEGAGGPKETGDAKSFGKFLEDSLNQVNSLQSDANVAMEKLASGNSQNLHETLLAVEKADIAFKTMNQVRLKVIDAYKEIMKIQM